MKEEKIYKQPYCVATTLVLERLFCASFNDKDHTENWLIEDAETI